MLKIVSNGGNLQSQEVNYKHMYVCLWQIKKIRWCVHTLFGSLVEDLSISSASCAMASVNARCMSISSWSCLCKFLTCGMWSHLRILDLIPLNLHNICPKTEVTRTICINSTNLLEEMSSITSLFWGPFPFPFPRRNFQPNTGAQQAVTTHNPNGSRILSTVNSITAQTSKFQRRWSN